MNPTVVAPNTRELLLEAAANLLQRVGYASFSFRDLADAVGIRAASVHYHFPTKADLGLALITWFRTNTEHKEREFRESHPDVRERLLALANHVAGYCSEQKSCPLNILQAEFAVLPPSMQEAVKLLIDEKMGKLAKWLDEGRAAGQLRFPGEAIAQARLVWSVLEYGTQLARTHPEQSYLALMRQLVDTMSPTVV
jgi:TetR/AcrR family transcriptional repressor of nem operon